MLKFNAGVQVSYFNHRLSDVLENASAWSLLARIDVYVTSIDDKQHGPATLHGSSLAIDLGVAGNVVAQLTALHTFLARYLPTAYDVLLEADHIHVEWDTKRRTAPAAPPTAPGTVTRA